MVSIVIPLYNKEKSIRATINSVLSQSYTEFELIVVNDGSTDGSLSVVQSINDNRIRIIDKPNRGVSAARNEGIRIATSQYVALIDGDDLWDKECLQTLVEMTWDFPDAGMWGINYADLYKGSVYPYEQGFPIGFRGYVRDFFTTSHRDIFCSSSVLLRKDIATNVGLFDERVKYSEDIDLWYRIILNSPVCFYNKVLAYYNKDADNRVERNRFAHFDIHYRYEYYIEKYVEAFNQNPDFARYVGMRMAYNILSGDYYFGNNDDRKATDHIVKYLPYYVLPYKYTLIFKTPRWFGWFMYQLTIFIKKAKNTNK